MTARRKSPVFGAITSAVLISIVVSFFVIRLTIDVPNLLADRTPPPDDFAYRYSENFLLAYAHIVPGVVYLLGAPIQLWRRFRNRHLRFHRRLGRFLLGAGIVSGLFAVLFGVLYSFGGWLEAAASVVFGVYFVVALALAFRSIRSGDSVQHRRWMVRAFAVALGVGTIRIWIGLFEATGLLTFQEAFGPAFWLAFLIHAAAGEIWLRRRPV